MDPQPVPPPAFRPHPLHCLLWTSPSIRHGRHRHNGNRPGGTHGVIDGLPRSVILCSICVLEHESVKEILATESTSSAISCWIPMVGTTTQSIDDSL